MAVLLLLPLQSYGDNSCIRSSEVYPLFVNWVAKVDVDKIKSKQTEQVFKYLRTDFLGLEDPQSILTTLSKIQEIESKNSI